MADFAGAPAGAVAGTAALLASPGGWLPWHPIKTRHSAIAHDLKRWLMPPDATGRAPDRAIVSRLPALSPFEWAVCLPRLAPCRTGRPPQRPSSAPHPDDRTLACSTECPRLLDRQRSSG